MSKKIVHLSDTSHPFTTYDAEPDFLAEWEEKEQHAVNQAIRDISDNTDNTDIKALSDKMVDLLFSVKVDETDNTTRTLTKPEFRAVDAFLRNWGYNGWRDMSDDLVDMLADETTDTTTAIDRFMNKWDLYRDIAFFEAIRTDLQNLFVLRITVTDDNPRILHFSDDERKALESLEGEKSDMYDENVHNWDKVVQNERAELFREEADKRVTRYFIGQTGWAWYVHFIVDMPEEFDPSTRNVSKSLYRAKDGRTTLHMTSLYMSEEKAWERIHEDIRGQVTYGDDETLTHVVELDKM